MLNRTRILVSGLIPLICVLSLAGCGQTGPLHLPKVSSKAQAASTTPSPPVTQDSAPTTP